MLGLHCFVQAFSGYGEGELLFVVVRGLLIAVVQFLPYVQLFETPMDCSTLGFPVLHYLPEPAQACVHWVSDAIQPSPSLSPLLLLPSVFPSISLFHFSLQLVSLCRARALGSQLQQLQCSLREMVGWHHWFNRHEFEQFEMVKDREA